MTPRTPSHIARWMKTSFPSSHVLFSHPLTPSIPVNIIFSHFYPLTLSLPPHTLTFSHPHTHPLTFSHLNPLTLMPLGCSYMNAKVKRNPLVSSSCAEYYGYFSVKSSDGAFTAGTNWLVRAYMNSALLYTSIRVMRLAEIEDAKIMHRAK